MSDAGQGPGWWQASDEKWYPPNPAPGWWLASDGKWYPPASPDGAHRDFAAEYAAKKAAKKEARAAKAAAASARAEERARSQAEEHAADQDKAAFDTNASPFIDSDVVWAGDRKSIGPGHASYKINTEYLIFNEGLLGSRSEQVPLWAIRDVDVKQSMVQRSRSKGDVIVHVEHSEYTGRKRVQLESIQSPHEVRDIINHEAQRARVEHQQRSQSTFHHGLVSPPSTPLPIAVPSAPPVSIADELRKLAELRDLGALTEEEFAMQKSKLLG